MILGPSVLQLSSENDFTVSGLSDLDLWPYEPKLIRVFCQSWPTSLSTFMILSPLVVQLSSRNDFTVSGSCDLDIWGHLSVMTNLPITSHDPSPNHSPIIIWKWFYCFFAPVTLTFDLISPKSIGVICHSWPTSLLTFMILGHSVL